VLHYSNGAQFFQEHYDYFDPARDPPESFEQGGNRYITVIVYLEVLQSVACNSETLTFTFSMKAALEGGETHFPELGLKLTAQPGDALMFYNLKEHCSGTDPDCVEKVSEIFNYDVEGALAEFVVPENNPCSSAACEG